MRTRHNTSESRAPSAQADTIPAGAKARLELSAGQLAWLADVLGAARDPRCRPTAPRCARLYPRAFGAHPRGRAHRPGDRPANRSAQQAGRHSRVSSNPTSGWGEALATPHLLPARDRRAHRRRGGLPDQPGHIDPAHRRATPACHRHRRQHPRGHPAPRVRPAKSHPVPHRRRRPREHRDNHHAGVRCGWDTLPAVRWLTGLRGYPETWDKRNYEPSFVSSGRLRSSAVSVRR